MNNLSAFINHLETLANADEDTITKIVANEALNREESEVVSWFEGLLQHGCQSGWVSSMIWYTDTEAFFDKYYHEILEYKEEYEEAIGQPMKIPYQLKNHLAWFAYEYVANKLYTNLKL